MKHRKEAANAAREAIEYIRERHRIHKLYGKKVKFSFKEQFWKLLEYIF